MPDTTLAELRYEVPLERLPRLDLENLSGARSSFHKEILEMHAHESRAGPSKPCFQQTLRFANSNAGTGRGSRHTRTRKPLKGYWSSDTDTTVSVQQLPTTIIRTN